jgi:hypothetical protein
METILVFYWSGLVICGIVGTVLSLYVLRDLAAAVRPFIPERTVPFVTRFVKVACIFAALVGGVSAKFYGCNLKYDALIGNPALLSLKVAAQLEAAMRWLLIFFIALIVITAAAYIIMVFTHKEIRR